MSRNRPITLRGRITLLVTVIAALALIPVGIGGVALIKAITSAIAWQTTTEAGTKVAAERREPGSTILLDDLSANLIQVVTADGEVVAASHDAQNMLPMSTVRPPPDSPVTNFATCLPSGCVHLTAIRVSPASGSPVVYAGTATPLLLSTWRLEVAAALQIALVVALIGWITWVVTGRSLRPIETMRDELGSIRASDLSRRVSTPDSAEEVHALSDAVNTTLARLERSADQQRQFASDASHELRTPLAGLRAHLESAQLYPEDTDISEMAESALRDADRIEAIISDLLLLTRIGSTVGAAKEPVNLAELVKGRDAQLELTEDLVVMGVRTQLERMAGNLMDNAARHAVAQVTVTLREEQGYAVLTVDNDGPPIPPEERERIFERFTRLDPARCRKSGGTGLGLAIARDVAIAHNGTLHVEDGACFVLKLPLHNTNP